MTTLDTGLASAAYERTRARSAIDVGRMHIPDIAVIAAATQGRPCTDEATISFEPTRQQRRALDPLVAASRAALQPQLEARAAANGAPLFDGTGVDIVAAHLTPGTRPHYRLTPAPASYIDFAVSAARLDTPTPAEVDPQQRTLRELWGRGGASLTESGTLPTVVKVGSGTVAITADDRIVLGLRGKTAIAPGGADTAGRRKVHIVAEGAEPHDLDATGRFDPAVTSMRGLAEELHLGRHPHPCGPPLEHIRAGVFFDELRWQLGFIHVAQLDCTADDLADAVAHAHDGWEVEGLVTVPFDIHDPNVRALMQDEHRELTFASNHAAAALWFALLWRHGHDEIAEQLTR